MERGSFASSPKLQIRELAMLSVGAIAGLAAYVAASAWIYGLGFPLDDSWIHATYARNLALTGEWVLQPGRPSAGSTAPLWTALLVPGYWLGLAPLWWSYFLGLVTLLGLGMIMEVGIRRLEPNYRPRFPWLGLFVVTEWHLLWAAVSGMETILQALLVTTVLLMLMGGSRNHAALGLLTGLSIWLRPDGLILAGAVAATLAVSSRGATAQPKALASYLFGVAALLAPYVMMNLWLSGTPMPNTFYAKQAEYAAWQARPVVDRLAPGLAQLSAGPAVLLWPGLCLVVLRILRTRDIKLAMALAWCVAFVVAYLLRLPPYQHGRYLVPVMPILFLLGFLGTFEVWASASLGRLRWMVVRVWQASIACLGIGFLVLGAQAYGQDVGLIEAEMVSTAKWISRNLPADAVIAAHDIGALAYFDDHSLIDLAGLASPDVVPFIRDEVRLADYLDRRRVKYLVAFRTFYPHLASFSVPVYSSTGRFGLASGFGNMTVYCWRCP